MRGLRGPRPQHVLWPGHLPGLRYNGELLRSTLSSSPDREKIHRIAAIIAIVADVAAMAIVAIVATVAASVM